MRYHITAFFMALAALIAGYRVLAYWSGRVHTHRARSRRDALDWMRCYGTDATVEVYKRGRFICRRVGRA